MIIADRTIQHAEPVFLNVYDLHSDYRPMSCLFNYCACRLLGAYHTVSEMRITFLH
jgi:hypothetical protein